MFKIGDEVRRIQGESRDFGTVVEVAEATGRARVLWHTYTYQGRVNTGRTSKRTWVAFKFLEVTPPEELARVLQAAYAAREVKS